MEYKLYYKQPREYDDDSPSGIGDHGILYHDDCQHFTAGNDERAKLMAREFVKAMPVLFEGKSYFRQFVKLERVTEPVLITGVLI